MRLTLLFMTMLTVALLLGVAVWVKNASERYLPVELSYFKDSTNHLSAAQIAQRYQAGQFKSNLGRRVNFGYTDDVYWLHFRVGADATPADFSFEVVNSKINLLELFQQKNNQFVSLGKTGDFFPFAQRPTPTHSFAYRLQLEPFQSADYFLLVDKRHEDLATEIRLWRTIDFEQADQNEYMFWGIFTGFVLLISILNIFFRFVTRDQVYTWYVLYIIAFALRQYTDIGFSFEFLWPNLPIINRPDALLMSVWLYIFPFLSFIAQFVKNTPAANKLPFRLIHYYKWVVVPCFIFVVICIVTGISANAPFLYITLFRVYRVLSIPIVILTFWSAIVALTVNNRIAVYYGFAVLVQALMQLANVFQIFSRNESDGVFIIEAYMTLTISFIIDLVVFSMGLSYRYNKFRKETEQLEETYSLVKQEQNANMIEALEYERHSITQQLNEEVGSLLASSRFSIVQALKQPSLQEQVSVLSAANKLIDKGVEDLKTIMLNLVPVEFAEQGLATSLQKAVLSASSSNEVSFHFELSGTIILLPIATEVQVYRIATELINNILKHSQATQAYIRLRYTPTHLWLYADDNGKGFDIKTINEGKGGIGVSNLHSRAEYLQAELSIQSSKEGTKITVCVPVNKG